MKASKEKYIEYVKDVQKSTTKLKEPSLPRPTPGKDFLKERNEQRGILFKFALWVSGGSLGFLVLVILLQTYLRVHFDKNFEIISDKGLQIIAVAIFGQVFGIVYIIAKAIWSNHEFEWMKTGKK